MLFREGGSLDGPLHILGRWANFLRIAHCFERDFPSDLVFELDVDAIDLHQFDALVQGSARHADGAKLSLVKLGRGTSC